MPEYPHHLRSFDYQGLHRYFLTFCTFERRRHFVADDRVDCVQQQLLRVSTLTAFAIPAYCFMPDHLHVLTVGERHSSHLLTFVRRFKQYSGYHFGQRFGVRLWQRFGYERVLRDSEDTATVVRYVINNPIRAGLVANVNEYPFWGSLNSTREALIEMIRFR